MSQVLAGPAGLWVHHSHVPLPMQVGHPGPLPWGAEGSPACGAGPPHPHATRTRAAVASPCDTARSSCESLDRGHLCHSRWAQGLHPALLQTRIAAHSSSTKNRPHAPPTWAARWSDVPGGHEQEPRAVVAGGSSRSCLPFGAVGKSRRGLTAAVSQPERERERLQSHPCVGTAANNGGGQRGARCLGTPRLPGTRTPLVPLF